MLLFVHGKLQETRQSYYRRITIYKMPISVFHINTNKSTTKHADVGH